MAKSTQTRDTKAKEARPETREAPTQSTGPRLALVARHDDQGGVSIGVEKWDASDGSLSAAVLKGKSRGRIDSAVRMMIDGTKGSPTPTFVFDSGAGDDRLFDAPTLMQLAKSLRSFQGRFERITDVYGAPSTRVDCVKRLLSRVAVASADPEKSSEKKADRLLVRVEASDPETGYRCDTIEALVKA